MIAGKSLIVIASPRFLRYCRSYSFTQAGKPANACTVTAASRMDSSVLHIIRADRRLRWLTCRHRYIRVRIRRQSEVPGDPFVSMFVDGKVTD